MNIVMNSEKRDSIYLSPKITELEINSSNAVLTGSGKDWTEYED